MNDATCDHDKDAATSRSTLHVPLSTSRLCRFNECNFKQHDRVKNI